ncbi:MAG: flippase-like domain-containing protein [Candidatus Eisenbacteria bacterium]|nr:flippase-like domain-containing protein [Candidatus Eisenbacteria bacterium]
MKRLEWLFLALGAGLFLLLLRQFGLVSLLNSLAGQGPLFLLVLIPTAVSYLLFCFAWWLALDPAARRELKFRYLFLVSIAGFSLNYMTPFIALGGEPLKMMLISRRLGKHRAVSSVIAYNALHVLSHMGVFIVALVLGFWLLELTPTRVVALGGGAAAAGLVAFALLTAHQGGLVERLFGWLGRQRLVKIRADRLASWQERLVRYDDSVTSFYRERRGSFWLALGADFLGRAIWAMEVMVMMANVGIWLNPLRTFFAHSVSSLMQVATFFVPYELGVKEGSFYLCLKWLEADPSYGIYLGVASRLRELIWIAGGLAIMAALGVRRMPKLAEAPEESRGGPMLRPAAPRPRGAEFGRKAARDEEPVLSEEAQ